MIRSGTRSRTPVDNSHSEVEVEEHNNTAHSTYHDIIYITVIIISTTATFRVVATDWCESEEDADHVYSSASSCRFRRAISQPMVAVTCATAPASGTRLRVEGRRDRPRPQRIRQKELRRASSTVRVRSRRARSSQLQRLRWPWHQHRATRRRTRSHTILWSRLSWWVSDGWGRIRRITLSVHAPGDLGNWNSHSLSVSVPFCRAKRSISHLTNLII